MCKPSVQCELFIDIFYPLLLLLLFVYIHILLLQYIYKTWLQSHPMLFPNMFSPPKKSTLKAENEHRAQQCMNLGFSHIWCNPLRLFFSDAWNAELNILFSLSDLCRLLSVDCLPKTHEDRSLVLLVLVTEEANIFGK